MIKLNEFKFMQNLKKGELHSFLTVFISVCSRLNENDIPEIVSNNTYDAEYKEKSDQLSALYNQMSLSFNKRSPTPQSIYLKEQNQIRKSAFISISQIIKANLRSRKEAEYSTILQLSSIVKKYKKITTANFKETTSYIDNFIHDINMEDYKEINKKLTIESWITAMSTANTDFKNDTIIRSNYYEQIVKYNSAMKRDLIKSYHNLEYCINAMAFAELFSNQERSIALLNGTINEYVDIVQKRLSTYKNKKKNDKPIVRTEQINEEIKESN